MVDIEDKFGIGITLTAILAIVASGIFFGFLYYGMDTIQSGLESTNCIINNNVYFENCQDIFEMMIYPVLGLRSLLIWISYFFIFAVVLGLLVLGYRSGKSQVMLGILIGSIIVLTYLSIEISNIYRSLIEVPIIEEMLTPFYIYNLIMWNFPTFVFIITLFSFMLALINYQRAPVNNINPGDLNF